MVFLLFNRYFPASVMAKISPFKALRPNPELASRVCELPYDVMSRDEAAKMAENNPHSFLHVSRPEINCASEIDVYADEVYRKGAENFDLLKNNNTLIQDSSPSFYLYQQIMGGHRQVGLVAVASCEEYDAGTIKKHELTRPIKEDDRVRHIEALDAQTGPVFLTYQAVSEVDDFIEKAICADPDIDFVAEDGVRHSSWTISAENDKSFINDQFSLIESLYIADGHHRSAAASRVNVSRCGAGGSGQFLAVIFPHNQMQILPYNRVVKSLNGLEPDDFIAKLSSIFHIENEFIDCPKSKKEIGLYFRGGWNRLIFKDEIAKAESLLEGLDVALLQNHILGPLLGIDDPRTSRQIDFVGGIRGNTELERLVDGGEYICAFSLYPTGIEDLMGIADSNVIMPPKSTWFEPKLRDGMFSHLI